MQNITTVADLRKAIQLLEEEEKIKRQMLQDHFIITLESLKPINILKKSVKDISSAPDLIDDVIGNVAGFAAGYLSNKVFVGSSGNVLKKIFGAIIQLGVTRFVSNYPEAIKSISRFVLEYFLRKTEEKTETAKK